MALFKRTKPPRQISNGEITLCVFILAAIFGVIGGFSVDFGFKQGGNALEMVGTILFAFGCFAAAAVSDDVRSQKKEDSSDRPD